MNVNTDNIYDFSESINKMVLKSFKEIVELISMNVPKQFYKKAYIYLKYLNQNIKRFETRYNILLHTHNRHPELNTGRFSELTVSLNRFKDIYKRNLENLCFMIRQYNMLNNQNIITRNYLDDISETELLDIFGVHVDIENNTLDDPVCIYPELPIGSNPNAPNETTNPSAPPMEHIYSEDYITLGIGNRAGHTQPYKLDITKTQWYTPCSNVSVSSETNITSSENRERHELIRKLAKSAGIIQTENDNRYSDLELCSRLKKQYNILFKDTSVGFSNCKDKVNPISLEEYDNILTQKLIIIDNNNFAWCFTIDEFLDIMDRPNLRHNPLNRHPWNTESYNEIYTKLIRLKKGDPRDIGFIKETLSELGFNKNNLNQLSDNEILAYAKGHNVHNI